MYLHFGLRFFLAFANIFGLKKFPTSNNKWSLFISELNYNLHFVLFVSFYLLFLVINIAQISLNKKNEAEKDEKLNDAVNTLFSFLFWSHGFLYCCLTLVLLIYSRIYSEKLLRIIINLRRHSRCNENYMFFLLSSVQAMKNICFAIANSIIMYLKLNEKSSFVAALYIISFFHIWLYLLNFKCLFICFTEQISNFFKEFLKNVSKLEKTKGRVFLYRSSDDKEKEIIRILHRILFSTYKMLDDFYSFFQKPICFIFSSNLLFLMCNVTRLTKFGFLRNFISSLQALFLAFVIVFLSDVVYEQVCEKKHKHMQT